MDIILAFLLGVLVALCVTRYKVNKLLKQLVKVSSTGEEMWQHGILYAISQIQKML